MVNADAKVRPAKDRRAGAPKARASAKPTPVAGTPKGRGKREEGARMAPDERAARPTRCRSGEGPPAGRRGSIRRPLPSPGGIKKKSRRFLSRFFHPIKRG